jgi:coenzyme F420-0:L-glutamate ligase
MKVTGIRTHIIQAEENLSDVFLQNTKTPPTEDSILIITSKVVSVAEGSVVQCCSREEQQRIIFNEADEVLGKAEKYDFWLTKKNGFLLPNAGIDLSNAKEQTAILLPKDSVASAQNIREEIQKKTGVQNFGVIVCDSRVLPFRRGISGIALGWAGFVGISDERGKTDLYGKKLAVSEIAVADDLSSMAQIFFGQANEQIPFVLAENVPAEFTDTEQDCSKACIKRSEDLFADVFFTVREAEAKEKKKPPKGY